MNCVKSQPFDLPAHLTRDKREIPMRHKTCTKCHKSLPETKEFFHADKRRGGFRPRCISCVRDYEAKTTEHRKEVARQYREKNKDVIKARKAEYNRQNKEGSLRRFIRWLQNNREHYLEHQRKYAASRKKKKREYDKRYREKNRDKIVSRQNSWKQENIEHARMKGRAATARHNALKRNAEGHYTEKDIKRIYKQQGGRCFYCKVVVGIKYHVDHVIPLSRGGSNSPENIVIACPACNVRKSSKTPEEWEAHKRSLLSLK